MIEDKGPWQDPNLPADRAERASRRKAFGITLDYESLEALISINSTDADICRSYLTDMDELDEWTIRNFQGMRWAEFRERVRAKCVNDTKNWLQGLAKRGHVRAMELTMADMLGSEKAEASNRITIKMDIGGGEDEK